MDLKDSNTKINLMRAFAGESQARNRYTIAAEAAEKQGMHIIKDLFIYTANQEKAHAEVFYRALKSCNSENVNIEGGYPVSYYDDIAKLLRAAEHGEFQEYDDVYPNFAKVAKEEGFIAISNTFKNIAEVEKKHGERFGKYADMIEKDTLYNREEETIWMCTNCGYIYEGKSAPNACPVCSYPKGYFIEFEESPFD